MAYRHLFPIADGQTVVNSGVTTTPYPVIAANGFYPSAEGFSYSGGTGTLEVFGTFGGGTATLQMRGVDRTTWIPIGTGITANSVTGFVSPSRQLRLAITGATTPALYAAVNKVTGD